MLLKAPCQLWTPKMAKELCLHNYRNKKVIKGCNCCPDLRTDGLTVLHQSMLSHFHSKYIRNQLKVIRFWHKANQKVMQALIVSEDTHKSAIQQVFILRIFYFILESRATLF